MFLIEPVLILAVTAALGAVIMAWLFSRSRLSPLLGAAAGGAASVVGTLFFMLPLNFCTFDAERDTIDRVFGVALIGIGMAVMLWLVQWAARWWQRRRTPEVDTGVQWQQPGMFHGWMLPVLFLAPTLIVLALFLYYPSIDNFRLSTLLVRLGARRTVFVCVDNFTSLMADPDYYTSLLITIGISLAIVVLGMGLALLIALAAYQPVMGARFYRTFLIWPYAISPAVAGVIFLLLFNPAGGIINYLLGNMGIRGPGWLNDPAFAPWAVIIASVWKSMGFNILFYIAGLQNVPKDLQESAAIDGANAVQRFRHITFPLLSPITFFLIITNMTYAFFETFGTIDYLTRGGPLESTTTLMYRIYQVGIQNNDLGKAAAQSIILFVMVIGLTVLQFRSTGRRVTYGA